MKLRHVLTPTLLYSAAAFTQTNDSGNGTFFRTTDQSCPVGINAMLEERGMITSVEGKKQRTDGPSLHLILNNARARQIVSAEVIVHGYPKGGRIAPAVVRHPDPDEITKRFPLTGPIAPGESVVFYLSLTDLRAVAFIDVETLKYADGSLWRPGRNDNCHAFGSTPVEAVEKVNP